MAEAEEDTADEPESWNGGELWVSLPAPALELGLSDHALYIIALLSAPKRLAENGWRPLRRKDLDDRLGDERVDGKAVERTARLLGTRKRPDEGELITRKIVERYPSYWADPSGNGRAQEYRLVDRAWLGAPRKGVQLCLRPSGRAKTKVETVRPDELPVPPFLRRVYPHVLDVEASVEHILEDVRRHAPKRRRPPVNLNTRDFDALTKAIDAVGKIKNPELAGKRGRPPQGVCRDLRERWQHALEHVFSNYIHSRPADHRLHRAHGRLFSPFVHLWSPLRQHVRLRGERLVELDIKNAQPLLIGARMLVEGYGDVPDVRRYVDLCRDGRIYEFIYGLLHDGAVPTPEQRSRLKVGFYSGWMFCEVGTMDKSDFGVAMTRAFATVDRWVRDQKEEDYASFACSCQRFESTLMVDKLAEVFERETIEVLTVHDTSYVRESQAERACELLRGEVLASLPIEPMVFPKRLGG